MAAFLLDSNIISEPSKPAPSRKVLEKKLILVTRNVKDFAPVQEFFPLKIENWFE